MCNYNTITYLYKQYNLCYKQYTIPTISFITSYTENSARDKSTNLFQVHGLHHFIQTSDHTSHCLGELGKENHYIITSIDTLN